MRDPARSGAGVSKMNPPPKRSILFLAVTGEEEGLLGSEYFAHYPTLSLGGIAANVNMDEDMMLWPLRDVIAYGAEHSSLEKVVEKAAEKLQLKVSPAPEPEESIFIRSDQYAFVEQGIPAVFLVAGFTSTDKGIDPEANFKNWDQTRYPEPQDDMQPPGLDFNQVVKYAQFIYLCGWLLPRTGRVPPGAPRTSSAGTTARKCSGCGWKLVRGGLGLCGAGNTKSPSETFALAAVYWSAVWGA
jgi:Zn-dependent M28 family amino/carboxypeptidase